MTRKQFLRHNSRVGVENLNTTDDPIFLVSFTVIEYLLLIKGVMSKKVTCDLQAREIGLYPS